MTTMPPTTPVCRTSAVEPLIWAPNSGHQKPTAMASIDPAAALSRAVPRPNFQARVFTKQRCHFHVCHRLPKRPVTTANFPSPRLKPCSLQVQPWTSIKPPRLLLFPPSPAYGS
ncbi:hypothetical protein M0R45_009818 [Rubus argutus]|uniref:Uncharacterized protein n=1 Tax=Rubus argutus TaxID=59490 RepID=A0AAW1Y678_RUBAR